MVDLTEWQIINVQFAILMETQLEHLLEEPMVKSQLKKLEMNHSAMIVYSIQVT